MAKSESDHPIYILIIDIVSNYLWPWLAREISSKNSTDNLYKFWIEENQDLSSAYKMGYLLQNWIYENWDEFDEDKAKHLYNQAMVNEFEVFNYFSKTYI